jgi:hypothetical protein
MEASCQRHVSGRKIVDCSIAGWMVQRGGLDDLKRRKSLLLQLIEPSFIYCQNTILVTILTEITLRQEIS